MDYRFLQEIVDLSKYTRGEPNDRYFRETDEGFKYTDQYIYKMANEAKSFFGEAVMKLDDPEARKYTIIKEGEFTDKEAEAELKAPYANKLKIVDEKFAEYKESHKDDEFEEQLNINSQLDTQFIKGFVADLNLSLEEAIQGYWCAGEILKRYAKGEEGWENLDKYVSLESKDEFKDKHKDLKNKWREELGIPAEETFKVKKHDVRVAMKPGRHPEPSDDESIKEYSEQLTKYLCE